MSGNEKLLDSSAGASLSMSFRMVSSVINGLT